MVVLVTTAPDAHALVTVVVMVGMVLSLICLRAVACCGGGVCCEICIGTKFRLEVLSRRA